MTESQSQNTILLVDDDPQIIELIKLHLENDNYIVECAKSGEAALQLLEKDIIKWSVIVSDVSMPGMDGYLLCQTIREKWPEHDIPFIFISINSTLEEKLQGYAVGGDDYITKPLEPAELLQKIHYNIERQSQSMAINQQLRDSQQAAFQAMSYTGNLGLILQFVQNSLNASNLQELANMVFEVTEGFMLNCVLQFHQPDGIVNYNSHGKVKLLESNVLEMARDKGRIFDFNNRTILNHANFSLLIKNMPVDDAETYGTLKDALGNLCNAIEVRTEYLMVNDISVKKEELIRTVNTSVADVERALIEIQRENLTAIEDMKEDLEEAMLSLGLLDSQEDKIRGIVQSYISKTEQIFNKAERINQQFERILSILNNRPGM